MPGLSAMLTQFSNPRRSKKAYRVRPQYQKTAAISDLCREHLRPCTHTGEEPEAVLGPSVQATAIRIPPSLITRRSDEHMDMEPASSFNSSTSTIPSSLYSMSPTVFGSYRSAKSTTSIMSAFSQCDEAVMSGPPKRGRRRKVMRLDSATEKCPTQHIEPPVSQLEEPAFFCTFCGKELSAKTWKRHEETQHLPRRQWVCMPSGFRVSDSQGDSLLCLFCGLEEPDDDHSQGCHRIAECLDPPDRNRTFVRKDHLAQHLKNFHSFQMTEDIAEGWQSEVDYTKAKWTCGFCHDSLDNWNDRARHIAKHFRAGLAMDAWCSSPSAISSQDDHLAVSRLSSKLRNTGISRSARSHASPGRFCCKSLAIGSWHRMAELSTDLIVFYSVTDRSMYYYMMEDAIGYRIEMSFNAIDSLSLHTNSNESHPEGLVLTLNSPPKFSISRPEIGQFVPCEDFTSHNQASISLQHYLEGDAQELLPQLSCLLSLEEFHNRHKAGVE